MPEESESQETQSSKFDWLKNALSLLLVGTLGPINFYFIITDPDYDKGRGNWFWWVMPFGIWLLFGMLISGIVIAWTAGVKHYPDWEKRGEAAFKRWLKLGAWLVAIAVGLLALIWAFGAASNYLDKIDTGTRLIAALLLMILFALWGIVAKLSKRD